MSDPTELLRQMVRRSTLKLTTPKNLAKPSWLGCSDLEIAGLVVGEIEELRPEVAMLLDVITSSRESAVQIDAATRTLLWDRIADEAGDVYHIASMGADPRRIARTIA